MLRSGGRSKIFPTLCGVTSARSPLFNHLNHNILLTQARGCFLKPSASPSDSTSAAVPPQTTTYSSCSSTVDHTNNNNIWSVTQAPVPHQYTALLEHYCRDRGYHSHRWLTLSEGVACYGASPSPHCTEGLLLPRTASTTKPKPTHKSKSSSPLPTAATTTRALVFLGDRPSNETEDLINKSTGLTRSLLNGPSILDEVTMTWRRATRNEVLTALGQREDHTISGPPFPPSDICFAGPLLLMLSKPAETHKDSDEGYPPTPQHELPDLPSSTTSADVHGQSNGGIRVFNAQDFTNPFLIDPSLRHISVLSGLPIAPDDASSLTSAMALRGLRSMQWVSKEEVSAAQGKVDGPLIQLTRDVVPVAISFDQNYDILPSACLPVELRERLLARVPPNLRGVTCGLLRAGNLDWRRIPYLPLTLNVNKNKHRSSSKSPRKKTKSTEASTPQTDHDASPSTSGDIPSHFIPSSAERALPSSYKGRQSGKGGRSKAAPAADIDVWFLAKDFDDLFGTAILGDSYLKGTSSSPAASSSTTISTDASNLPALRHFLTRILPAQSSSPVRRIALPRSRVYYNLEQLEHKSFLTHPGIAEGTSTPASTVA